ncbi:MAG: uroporphyrinogen-III synthase [Saprospiraceae bacterium]|nr:uroporphyrinogen-III synthase [Saprospiraceae bacterium]
MQKLRQKIFISRALNDDSPIRHLEDKFDIIGESLLTFEPIPFGKTPESEWIFFYSQQGVRHFYASSQTQACESKVAAFGPKTALVLNEYGHIASFVGDGVAVNTAKGFAMLCKGERVLFVRAKNSRMSLQEEMDHHCEIIDLVVYDNAPRTALSLPRCDVLIFTSPLNAKSYFQIYPKSSDQKMIAIGSTTQEVMHEMGLKDVEIPLAPTEEAIATLLLNHFGL